MPVIVVGADTPVGAAIVEALQPGAAELRAFVTDPGTIDGLKSRGVKVAVGDVSDGSHVGGAAMRAFCAVLVPEAAVDDRERSFAATPAAVLGAWLEGVADAGVHRVIWLDDPRLPGAVELLAGCAAEVAVVPTKGRTVAEIAADVAANEARPKG